MAVTSLLYGAAFLSAFNKEIDLNEATKVKCSLHTSSYGPVQDTDNYWNDCTNEITGAGYTTGGVELTGLTPTYTGGTNVFAFDAVDAQWTAATFTCRIAVVYYNTGVSSTSPLLMYVDFGSDQSVSSGTFTIQWNAAGLFTVTVSAT